MWDAPTIVIGKTGSGKTYFLEKLKEKAKEKGIEVISDPETLLKTSFEEIIRKKPREKTQYVIIDDFELTLQKYPKIWEKLEPFFKEGHKFKIGTIIALQDSLSIPKDILLTILSNSWWIFLAPTNIEKPIFGKDIMNVLKLLNFDMAFVVTSRGAFIVNNKDLLVDMFFETRPIRVKNKKINVSNDLLLGYF